MPVDTDTSRSFFLPHPKSSNFVRLAVRRKDGFGQQIKIWLRVTIEPQSCDELE